MKQPQYYMGNVKKAEKGFVIIEKKIELPDNKTTTEGEYTKFKEDMNCAYPERASCNYGEFFIRCPYMKYNNTSRGWFCDYKKE